MKMLTFSGKTLDPENPQPSQIEILDIAVGLSRVPRFVGHTHHFYSVAEHSILVAELAKRDQMNSRIKLLALLHDAAEFAISDIPTPVKVFLKPAIVTVEDRLLEAIHRKFSIEAPTQEEKIYLKSLDVRAFEIENEYLRNTAWTALLDKNNLSSILPTMTSDQAALAFMRYFTILQGE